MEPSVLHVAPAGNKPLYFLIGMPAFMAIVPVAVSTLLMVTVHGSRHATFELSPAGLRLRGDLHGCQIPRAQLRGASDRVVDFRADPGLRPRSRRFGTGLPGYRAGWFRLASGEKALVCLTTLDCAAYVPTTAGYSLLLSVAEPERFVAELRALAPRP